MHLFNFMCVAERHTTRPSSFAICGANFSQAFLHIMLFLSKSFCFKVFSFMSQLFVSLYFGTEVAWHVKEFTTKSLSQEYLENI